MFFIFYFILLLDYLERCHNNHFIYIDGSAGGRWGQMSGWDRWGQMGSGEVKTSHRRLSNVNWHPVGSSLFNWNWFIGMGLDRLVYVTYNIKKAMQRQLFKYESYDC